MSSPDEPSLDDRDRPAPPTGPRNYSEVPLLRRNGFCSGMCVAHVAVMFLGGYEPLAGLFGLFTTIGVLVVCVVVLTGPVYYDKRKKDGTLRKWGIGNNVAAVILLLLFVGGYGALFYWMLSSGQIG